MIRVRSGDTGMWCVERTLGLMRRMRRRRVAGFSLVAFVILLCVGVVLVAVNRFWGKHLDSCGSYSDSNGRLDENGTRVCYVEGNQSHPDIDPGLIFDNTARSELAWIYCSIVSVLSSTLSLSCFLYRIWERRHSQGKVTQGQLNEHSGEHRRLCWVVYFCTALVLLYESVVFVKIVECHRTVEEGFYTAVSSLSHLFQGQSVSSAWRNKLYVIGDLYPGMYLFYEVNHRDVNQVELGAFFRSILVSQAILNFTLWADALIDTACRIEPDNAIFFGTDFWIICKPIFKAAQVALRILSSLLFLMLAQNPRHHNAGRTQSNGDVELSVGQRKKDLDTPVIQSPKKKIRRYRQQVEGLDNTIEHVGTVIRSLLSDDTSQNIVDKEGKRTLTSRLQRLLSKQTDMNYGVTFQLTQLKEGTFEIITEAINSRQVATRALWQALSFIGLLVILIPAVVLGFALRLVKGDHAIKYEPELVAHVIIIICCLSIIIPQSPVHHWTIKTRVPVSRRLKDLVYNPELSAITIFGIAATVYHLVLFIFFCKVHEHFVTAWPQVDNNAAVVSTILRLWVVWLFRMHHGATFRMRNDTLTECVLGLLVSCSLSVLIMDILREEFDENHHNLVYYLQMSWVKPVLAVLAPLSVDFSLHAALLLFSVYHDYIMFAGESGIIHDSKSAVALEVQDSNESKSLGYESWSPYAETSV